MSLEEVKSTTLNKEAAIQGNGGWREMASHLVSQQSHTCNFSNAESIVLRHIEIDQYQRLIMFLVLIDGFHNIS